MTDYYLQRVGFDCQDARLSVSLPFLFFFDMMLIVEASFLSFYLHFKLLFWSGPSLESCRKRLLALAAQKFVSDIAADAYQHARIRSNAAGGRARANQPPTTARVRVSVFNIGLYCSSFTAATYSLGSYPSCEFHPCRDAPCVSTGQSKDYVDDGGS